MKLTAGVDEADIGKIRPKMEVSFSVDSYPQQTFHGTVNAVRLNATTQNNVVTYPVWIDVPNPDLKLRPSMTAQVKIIVDEVNNVVRVPNQGLRFRPNAEMYAALGLQAPAAGQGRAGRGQNAGGQGTGAQGNGAAAAAAPAGAVATPAAAAPAAGATAAKPADATAATPTPAAQTAQAQPTPAAGTDANGGGANGNRRGGAGVAAVASVRTARISRPSSVRP